MGKAPVVAVVGRSDTGKTTFLEKLIRELKVRNIKVGTVKHHRGDFDLDIPGKDTWRHAQAGADAVAISSPSKMAVIRKLDQEMGLDRIAEFMGDMDIVLAEGYKRSDKPKIEIHRSAHSAELSCMPEELIALVSDAGWDIGVPVFGLEDASGVADLLVREYGLTGQSD